MIQGNKESIFISYSHADEQWLRRLKVHLKPLERLGKIESWDDTKIKSGDKWRAEIKKALEKSSIAILLISADFLASDFIASDELPPLLEAAKAEGLIVLPLILSHSSFLRMPELNQYQAVNKPDEPLDSLSKSEQEKVLDRIAARIQSLVDVIAGHPDVNSGKQYNQSDSSEGNRTLQVSASVQHLKYGSFVEIINNSNETISIDEVTISGNQVSYLELRWREVDLPKLSVIPPGKSTMLLFAVTENVSFNGPHLAFFSSWEDLEVKSIAGNAKEIWSLRANIIVGSDGNIKLHCINISLT